MAIFFCLSFSGATWVSDTEANKQLALVSTLRHSVSVPPADFDMKYHQTLPGDPPAVFLHRFPGRTRPQRAPRGPLTKNPFFFYTFTNIMGFGGPASFPGSCKHQKLSKSVLWSMRTTTFVSTLAICTSPCGAPLLR